MHHNSTLCQLDLHGCKIPPDIIKAICKALECRDCVPTDNDIYSRKMAACSIRLDAAHHQYKDEMNKLLCRLPKLEQYYIGDPCPQYIKNRPLKHNAANYHAAGLPIKWNLYDWMTHYDIDMLRHPPRRGPPPEYFPQCYSNDCEVGYHHPQDAIPCAPDNYYGACSYPQQQHDYPPQQPCYPPQQPCYPPQQPCHPPQQPCYPPQKQPHSSEPFCEICREAHDENTQCEMPCGQNDAQYAKQQHQPCEKPPKKPPSVDNCATYNLEKLFEETPTAEENEECEEECEEECSVKSDEQLPMARGGPKPDSQELCDAMDEVKRLQIKYEQRVQDFEDYKRDVAKLHDKLLVNYNEHEMRKRGWLEPKKYGECNRLIT